MECLTKIAPSELISGDVDGDISDRDGIVKCRKKEDEKEKDDPTRVTDDVVASQEKSFVEAVKGIL